MYWVIRRATRPATQVRYPDVRTLRIDIARIIERRPIEQKKHWPLYSAFRLVQRRPLASALSGIIALTPLKRACNGRQPISLDAQILWAPTEQRHPIIWFCIGLFHTIFFCSGRGSY